MAEPQRWHRHWTREGRDPLAGFAMRDDALADWNPDQLRAWQSLALEGESLPNLLRRIAREAADRALVKNWIDPADLALVTDEMIYGLALGAFAWNGLRPTPSVDAPPPTFYEASLRLGDRLMREALEKKDEAEARRLGIPADVIARAAAGQMPPPLEAPKSEGDEIRRRGWMRIVLRPVPHGSVAFVNPAVWAEPVSSGFDLPSFCHAIRLAILAAGDQSPRISLVNAAGALLTLGLPFDSPRGLGTTASLVAILRAEAGEMSRLLGLGTSSANHALREAFLQFPDTHRPNAGRIEPMRWRDAAIAALDRPDPWNGIEVTGESDPATEALLGGSAPGLGAIKTLAGRDGQAGLRAIGYEHQVQLDEAVNSLAQGVSPDFLSEEQAQVLRGMMPQPWGQVHPHAQIRRALDLAPLFDPPVDAIAGAEEITPTLRTLALEVAEKGGVSSVILFGSAAAAPLAAISVDSAPELTDHPRRLSLCRSDDGTLGFQAPGASASELALIQAILSLAQIDPPAALDRLPEDDSLAGQLRRELSQLV